jgi:hypothetical protein
MNTSTNLTQHNLTQHNLSILPNSIMSTNPYFNITLNLLTLIFIIIVLFVISYYIIINIDKLTSSIFFPQSELIKSESELIKPESELFKPKPESESELFKPKPESESELIKSELINLSPIINTKQIYKKYDEITLPSSVDGKSGYIGRDYICYKNKANNIDFMSSRPNCMVCQTDPTNNNYGNTNTNIISTCVYSDNIKNNEPMVWNKNMCINKCSVI